MTDAGWVLQQGLYARLNSALSVPVYDRVPPATAYPYVVISDQYALTEDPLARTRDVVFFTLSVWSRYKGQKQVREIITDIYDALHRQKFATTQGRVVRAYIQNRSTLREPDNETFMGQVVVRILFEH